MWINLPNAPYIVHGRGQNVNDALVSPAGKPFFYPVSAVERPWTGLIHNGPNGIIRRFLQNTGARF